MLPADDSQQAVSERFDSEVDIVKQLEFDPVSSDLLSLSSESSPQKAHAEAAFQLQAIDNDTGSCSSSNSDDLLDLGAQASAKPSHRRRAALDSDSDIEEICQQRMDSNSAAATLHLADTPPLPNAHCDSAYDFSTFSSDGSGHSAGSANSRGSAQFGSVLKHKGSSKSKKKQSRQHSKSVIALTSSDDDSR